MEVIVNGIGGHGYELEVIRRALEAAGIIVIMDKTTKDCWSIRDWRLEKQLVHDERERMRRYGIERVVVLKAGHTPWGG
jgi:methylmalonyl-CoA mutase cobalamin-binding subunit